MDAAAEAGPANSKSSAAPRGRPLLLALTEGAAPFGLWIDAAASRDGEQDRAGFAALGG